jgi:signal transduction histidine kinase
LESEIAGLSPSEGASPEEPDAGRFPVSYALLERGSVVSSSDPAVARSRGSFGPPEVTGVSATDSRHAWRTDDEEGLAVWSEERGAVVAARRRTADLGDGVVALARLVLVGVGLGLLAALVLTLAGIRRLRWRLHHKILLSYFLISVIPLAVLGLVSAAEARSRYERGLSERLATDIARVRSDLEAMGPLLFDRAADRDLVRWAAQRRHDLVLWRDGLVSASSRPGLVAAELLPSRLPSEAYAATVLERRETIRREASFAGRPVWFGYAPILDESDRAVATVGVPVLYPEDRIEEELAVTGSVVVAAYLLTLVAVLVGGIYAARRLAGPLDRLAAGTRKVAAGDLAVEIPEAGRDEVGELVQSFNEMTRHLREATARAAKAEREAAWSRMARQVAHEIKNPLTPIRLMIQQLEADVARDPARAAEAIRRTSQVVQRQIESLARIAADFAQFARLPQRRIQEVDPAGLVREVVHLWSGSSAHGVTVSADVPGALPTVAWDEQEMRRVLMNLVANAVQAIPGEGKVTVAGRAESRGGREGVVVAVSDTGVGIPPEALARLFEPDFSTKTSGTGLGLAIVRRILDDLGGEISVDTVVDRGSTFSTWFPRRPPAP